MLLGLALLSSQLCLCYGSVQERRYPVLSFLILSLSVLVLYWAWFVYLKYAQGESEASNEVRGKYRK